MSGQVVRFPLAVQVKMDDDLLLSEIGDEDFFEQVAQWKPDTNKGTREKIKASMAAVDSKRKRSNAPKKR